MKDLTLIEISHNHYEVFSDEEGMNTIGSFERDVDGFFYYWPKTMNSGCFSSYSLRLIANKLDEMNKEWNDHIDKNIK